VLSQQTEPFAQLAVFWMTTEGLSQNAAMILSKQKPGHLGTTPLVTWVVVVDCVTGSGAFSIGFEGTGFVIQQLSSPFTTEIYTM